ncbi:hypothetical protein IGI04_022529 [Brassica rapa subsp. trilocularis]|uniref:X8 domain-containing protein n=1 Tax=Brassica rapa subsp. trilocularis TaxID=1813537 RepID=A0ABQ7M164_BRACM|nr:hypothetical protein IGI04_022529 [Brassica rapa subsp. trilocularis]
MAVVVVLAVILLAMVGHSSGAWCVCREGLSEAMLQKTLDYACGAGADCGPIHQNGPCFNPNTVKSHCSYAVNSFFQKKGQSQGTCDFAGTATVSASDPSYTSCPFPASASGSGTTTPVTTTPSTRVPTTTNTRPYTSSTGGGLGIPSGIPDYTDPSSAFKLQNPRANTFFLSGVLVLSHDQLPKTTAGDFPGLITFIPSSSTSLLSFYLISDWIDHVAPSLMEALITSRVVPLRILCRKLSSVSADFSCLEFKRYPCRSGRVSVMNHPKLLRPVTASLQPQELSALGHEGNVVPSNEIMDLWRDVEAVCFDVDSTVCVDEGIDELAEFCGAGKAVAEWTARAMGGSVPFEEALAARLSLFKPSLSKVEEYLQKRPPRLSPGIEELVKKLRANKIDVYLISGGFRQMINPVASILGIPRENIFANNILFGNSGEFVGFDENEPTSRSGGKAKAVQQIRKARLYKTMAMIGDGATDLEARKPGGADLFICYAGVQLREAVAAQADWLIFKFEPLLNSLD